MTEGGEGNLHYSRFVSTQVAYFKALMHAADARFSVDTENWVPAAVSLYYALLDIAIAFLLSSSENPTVRHDSRHMSLDDALARGASDPYRLITHNLALRHATDHLQPEFSATLQGIRQLREYASYRPSMRVQDDGTVLIYVCEVDPNDFVRTIGRETARLELHFTLFVNHLRGRNAGEPGHPTLASVLPHFLQGHAPDFLRARAVQKRTNKANCT